MSNDNRQELFKKGAALAASATLATLVPQVSQAQETAQTQPVAPIVAASGIAPGPFKPTDESLQQYQYPDWFRDAKFGIWAHWGPQAVPRHGDWYAKKLYQEGDSDYKDHLQRYGHPSKAGYKDIIPLWKAEKWDPEKLMALYKKAGAKYFVSMGSHHDNFFLWNSKLHRWNAVNMGPHKDVVGLWQKAAQAAGLRFGVSEHLAASYTWFQTSHGADKTGPLAGVPYDGNDPQYQDLYHPPAAPDDTGWLTKNPEWHREWFNDVKELIDNYHPDLLYSDSVLPFGAVGRSMLAHYYNQDMLRHGGKLEAVYNCKQSSDGKWVQDLERGVMDGINPNPWQTDTSIGDWFYRTGQQYKSSTDVIQMLVDIVSKNGNLLINIVQTPEGDLEPDMLKTLDEIATWTAVNGEGIYGTRPWKIYGEKPASAPAVKAGAFNEGKVKYTAQDIRFTTKNGVLYAFCLGVPAEDIRIVSLAKNATLADKPVASVQLLGSDEKPEWNQGDDALVIKKPTQAPNASALAYKISFRN
ncbi:MAG: alpha-L-fucosidase [Abitibacteriaceae bacterium]|nr:alpha-L-fucosidase [Abditibacteriaceae bacterium]MBV9867525.1 alpha-L-fucosidase [Abditibacteriaceae bacterium]